MGCCSSLGSVGLRTLCSSHPNLGELVLNLPPEMLFYFFLWSCIILDEILHKRGALFSCSLQRKRSPGWVWKTKLAVPSWDLGTEHSTNSSFSLPAPPNPCWLLLIPFFPIFRWKIAQSWPSLDLCSPACAGSWIFAVWEGVVVLKLFLFLHQLFHVFKK